MTRHLRIGACLMIGPCLLIGLVALTATTSFAQKDQEPGGITIQVGPDRGAQAPQPVQPGFNEPPPAERAAPTPSYWIGMHGESASEALRLHLNLDGPKIIVRQVMPGSPAEKEGLKEHDILIAANNQPLATMQDLVPIVKQAGEGKGQITLEIIRRGQPETIWITPAERPANQRMPRAENFFGRFGGGNFDGGRGNIVIAPGVNGGIAISSSTNADGKTTTKIQRNGKTWEFDPNDPKALEQLPPDIRAMVQPNGQGFNLGGNFNLPGFGEPIDRQQQIEAMRRQMIELQRQLGVQGAIENPVEPPAAGEAGEPVEIEIPAE